MDLRIHCQIAGLPLLPLLPLFHGKFASLWPPGSSSEQRWLWRTRWGNENTCGSYDAALTLEGKALLSQSRPAGSACRCGPLPALSEQSSVLIFSSFFSSLVDYLLFSCADPVCQCLFIYLFVYSFLSWLCIPCACDISAYSLLDKKLHVNESHRQTTLRG